MLLLRIVLFGVGALLVLAAVRSAVRTFVLPRGVQDVMTRVTFRVMRILFNLRVQRLSSYAAIDSTMALYAPISVLTLITLWLALIQLAYTLMFLALEDYTLFEAFRMSGSSLLTLGFASVEDLPGVVLAFSEATLGLLMVALLITYLPTMYGAFQRRETMVTMLAIRAGSPPSAIELIRRFNRLERLDALHDLWDSWETWFAEVEESHTSLAALVFFRSPQPDHSWITAAGTVLDGAALMNAAIDVPHDVQADLTIRAGYLCLRRITAYFSIPYPEEPTADTPISISRAEFDAACTQLATDGVPLKPDREQAWRDFAGWRVNYDVPLLALAALTLAPIAPWSSDRAPRDLVLPLIHGPIKVGVARDPQA